jgi:predicted AAA+ superfamily ATPase
MPKITDLAKDLAVSRNSLLNYLSILERGGLINLLKSGTKGINSLAKPEKIYLNNTKELLRLTTLLAIQEQVHVTMPTTLKQRIKKCFMHLVN